MNRTQRAVDTYLIERDRLLHAKIQDLFKLLASKGKLGSGDSALGVRDICINELDENSTYFIEQLVREKRMYSRSICEGDIKKLLISFMNSRILFLNEKREASMDQAFGNNLKQSMDEASSAQDAFSRIKNESVISLDEKLLNLKESKGKTVKARIQYQLENNWLYLLVIALLALYGIWSTVGKNG